MDSPITGTFDGIDVIKVNNNQFLIRFISKTGVPGLVSYSAEVGVSRATLEKFLDRAQKALED